MTIQEVISTSNLSKNQYTLWQVLGIWLVSNVIMDQAGQVDLFHHDMDLGSC
jgi:hypothetical protein